MHTHVVLAPAQCAYRDHILQELLFCLPLTCLPAVPLELVLDHVGRDGICGALLCIIPVGTPTQWSAALLGME